MTSGPKIIGMWRHREEEAEGENEQLEQAETEDILELSEDDRDKPAENEASGAAEKAEEWSHYSDEESVASQSNGYIVPILLGLAIVSWTAFFAWANRDIFTTIPAPKEAIDLLANWCLPVVTMVILYLLYMRNSSREANRFADVASSLRTESDRLETRMKTINNELSIAREFLASETRELETLGSQSSEKLTSAADKIKTALGDGLDKMTKLDDVGGTAFKNLEQLREHLPVVINTAKDVTNQIGNAGRTSQAEIAAMVSTLKRVGDMGASAKQALDALTDRSEKSLDNLVTKTEDIKREFENQLSTAEKGSGQISKALKTSSDEVIEALQQARSDLASETSKSSDVIKADLEALETSLITVRTAADEEDERLKALASHLNQSVSDIAVNIENLDNESGEKTAKLAFAMTALEQNTASLQQALDSGHGAADGMIERMEKLLTALDSGARELDETLPAAFDRMSAKSEASMAFFGQMSDEADKAGTAADAISAKVERSGQLIEQQRGRLEKLRDDGVRTSDAIRAEIGELTQSLQDIREQNEALAESAGEKLVSALLRVKETAKQASDHSREALESAITGSADKFEQISEEALNRIVDEKIGSIAPKLESAVANAVATTQSTAGHLDEQLKAIEEMTTNLEQRILFAKEKAEQSSEENFTRRVALLTESLNSTAIDVSKLLSNEVTDTEWAAYLKGDRGIFTRRAVRLLDSGEVREILLEYENNTEFREHVNRYIHDFETMMRGILSTRDGSAISVTLLSSDIGKLYVALAQAIERLRS